MPNDKKTRGKNENLQELSQQDFSDALKQHERWIESGGSGGTQLDLSHTDIATAIEDHSLEETNLQKAMVKGARLQGLMLSLSDVSRGDDLQPAHGLSPEQLDKAFADGETWLPAGFSIRPCL